MKRFDAIWFDAGGVLVLPDPTVLAPLLAYFGGSADIDRHRRAHYAAMAVKSAQGAGELDWREYDEAYVASVGVATADIAAAAETLGRTRTRPAVALADPRERRGAGEARRRRACRSASSPTPPARSRPCCAARASARSAPARARRCAASSTARWSASPSPTRRSSTTPRCTSPARRRDRIAYVGDSVTMDIGGATAAGLHPILLDPYDDHPDAPFETITSLADLV